MLISLLLTGVGVGAIYSLLGLSLVLVSKASGVVNFAQGEMAMFGAFIALSSLSVFHLPVWIAFVLAISGGFVAGALIERVCIRPLRGAPEMNLLVVTIGLWFVFNGGAGWIWGYDPYRFPSMLSQNPVTIAGTLVMPNSLAVIGVGIVVMAVLYLFFEHTLEGVAMRAASMNPRSARLMGIRVGRVSLLAWGLANALGVLSAMLIAPITFLDQQMMVPVLLKAFAGAILGGFGSLPGAALGGLLIGVAETLLGVYVSNSFKDACVFTLIIVVLMVRPTGLFGRKTIKKV